MRVLILADDCNPDWPSLPVVGYKSARAISQLVETVVITHVRNKENIDRCGLGRADVRFIDSEYIARPLNALSQYVRGGTSLSWSTAIAFNYPSYLAFEYGAWRALRRELADQKFDIIHRLTPMSPTLPSPIASWSKIPFVLGPLNGGLAWPKQFKREMVRERELLTIVRGLYRYLPYHQTTFRDANAILAAFDHTVHDLPNKYRSKILQFPEVGVDWELFGRKAPRTFGKQKTFLFVGRLVPYKLPHVPILAFAKNEALRRHKLVIVGDGPERGNLEDLIRSNDLQAQVIITGWCSQTEVGNWMRAADAFVFPSIRELGAGVLVEAMAAGLCNIVIDYGAPASLIGAERGLKVPLASVDDIVSGFAKAMALVADDDNLLRKCSAAAEKYVCQYFPWETKAKKFLQVYEWVLGGGKRPEFYSEN